MRSIRILTTLAALTVAGSAAAQEIPTDWDVHRDPENESMVAFVPLTTGLTVAVRCNKGGFDAVIAGLPEAGRNQRVRSLGIAFHDSPVHGTRWNVTTDRTVAIADYPAPFARELREGGKMTIIIPNGAGQGRNLRHEIELPPSGGAVDETLTACDRPLVDPRDALLPEIEEGGLPAGVSWSRQPRPTFPRSLYGAGYAVISCLMTAEGGLDQCVLEAQQPADGAFGRAAMRATDRARLTSPNEVEGQYRPRIIAFRINFHGG